MGIWLFLLYLTLLIVHNCMLIMKIKQKCFSRLLHTVIVLPAFLMLIYLLSSPVYLYDFCAPVPLSYHFTTTFTTQLFSYCRWLNQLILKMIFCCVSLLRWINNLCIVWHWVKQYCLVFLFYCIFIYWLICWFVYLTKNTWWLRPDRKFPVLKTVLEPIHCVCQIREDSQYREHANLPTQDAPAEGLRCAGCVIWPKVMTLFLLERV